MENENIENEDMDMKIVYAKNLKDELIFKLLAAKETQNYCKTLSRELQDHYRRWWVGTLCNYMKIMECTYLAGKTGYTKEDARVNADKFFGNMAVLSAHLAVEALANNNGGLAMKILLTDDELGTFHKFLINDADLLPIGGHKNEDRTGNI